MTEDQIKELLRNAPEMTPQQQWDQRVSFAYGNATFENPDITRDMIEEAATKLYGPRP